MWQTGFSPPTVLSSVMWALEFPYTVLTIVIAQRPIFMQWSPTPLPLTMGKVKS